MDMLLLSNFFNFTHNRIKKCWIGECRMDDFILNEKLRKYLKDRLNVSLKCGADGHLCIKLQLIDEVICQDKIDISFLKEIKTS
mgnify:CR=1 FL=1